jgi:hypothetical protein
MGLNTYYIIFTGREVGALGITYPIHKIIKAETENEAVLELYNNYEMIHCLYFTEPTKYFYTLYKQEYKKLD